eukprot:scaffold189062_cov48-Prasinocladus_malaysianus.AAC.2
MGPQTVDEDETSDSFIDVRSSIASTRIVDEDAMEELPTARGGHHDDARITDEVPIGLSTPHSCMHFNCDNLPFSGLRGAI